MVGGFHHGIDEVKMDNLPLNLDLASLHWTAGDENDRDIQAHGSHQHARGNLVAVGDANHGVSTVSIDHVFDRIGDQVATG